MKNKISKADAVKRLKEKKNEKECSTEAAGETREYFGKESQYWNKEKYY